MWRVVSFWKSHLCGHNHRPGRWSCSRSYRRLSCVGSCVCVRTGMTGGFRCSRSCVSTWCSIWDRRWNLHHVIAVVVVLGLGQELLPVVLQQPRGRQRHALVTHLQLRDNDKVSEGYARTFPSRNALTTRSSASVGTAGNTPRSVSIPSLARGLQVAAFGSVLQGLCIET
jgi:hypothetical protein